MGIRAKQRLCFVTRWFARAIHELLPALILGTGHLFSGEKAINRPASSPKIGVSLNYTLVAGQGTRASCIHIFAPNARTTSTDAESLVRTLRGVRTAGIPFSYLSLKSKVGF